MSFPSSFKGCQIPRAYARHEVVERSLSAPGPNELCIKITATAINPVDWKMRDTGGFLEKYPAIIGSDAAGVVVAAGSGVQDFKTGDRVYFQGIIGNNDSATFQEYCKMPMELVSKTPSNVSDEEAAGVMLASMAVMTGFYSHEGHHMTAPWEKGGSTAGKDKSIIIIGGSGSVGQYAIQLARLSGYDRIVTNASPSNFDFLKSLGAHVVLDRSETTPEAFVDATNGVPLDFVFDGISTAPTQKLGVKTMQAAEVLNGRLITVHTVVPDHPDPEAESLARGHKTRVDIRQVLGLGSASHLRPWSEPFCKALSGEDGFVGKGLIVPNRTHVIHGGVSALEEALEVQKKGVSGKKVVLRVAES